MPHFYIGDYMPIVIDYRFTPLRMVLKKREKVAFDLFIKNTDEEPKTLTVRLNLSPDLAFTKGGFKTSDLIRIERIDPHEEKTIYLELWPRHNTTPGTKEINVVVQEHDAQYIKNQTSKTISFIVE